MGVGGEHSWGYGYGKLGDLSNNEITKWKVTVNSLNNIFMLGIASVNLNLNKAEENKIWEDDS